MGWGRGVNVEIKDTYFRGRENGYLFENMYLLLGLTGKNSYS